ncbi:unnamed protein product [marine sediment metagenome]|uniref:Uncharacterized protein n=1 Tax=marine sediment metagenome TaxID=412755 RepID=X0TBJ2_9ZZZZ
MGIETRVDVLKFTDGIRVIVTNKDRKRHWFIPADEFYSFSDEHSSISPRTKYFYRTMKITYKQWKNRWAT